MMRASLCMRATVTVLDIPLYGHAAPTRNSTTEYLSVSGYQARFTVAPYKRSTHHDIPTSPCMTVELLAGCLSRPSTHEAAPTTLTLVSTACVSGVSSFTTLLRPIPRYVKKAASGFSLEGCQKVAGVVA